MEKQRLHLEKPGPDFSVDHATQYALDVDDGKIIAGPLVRAACARHIRDLEHGAKRGLRWDRDAARDVYEFYYEVLRLNGGQFEGAPFELLPWQSFVVGSLFGWKLVADGSRRFRVAYIETGKGSGKSPLVAGFGLYGLVADREPRAEIYAGATKKDQAMVLFRDAVSMVKQSPLLASHIRAIGPEGREWNLYYPRGSGFFRPIASDSAQSGPRTHFGILDEVHEHRDGLMVEMMESSAKGRTQPLTIMITNSGTDMSSVCWEKHQYGTDVVNGETDDDSFFSFICSLDHGEDPFADEACWPKANPSLDYGLPGYRYLRDQVKQGQRMPSKGAKVSRLNFCQWHESFSPAISASAWKSSQNDFDLDWIKQRFPGRKGYAGLDLSSTLDLTALVLALEPVSEDPLWRVIPFFWTPEDTLGEKEKRDHAPYFAWKQKGFLDTNPGRSVSKLAVLRMANRLCETFDIKSIAYDRWRIEDLISLADDHRISLPLLGFGQGFKDMSPAIDEFETLLLDGKLLHNGNPVLTWCASNAIMEEDPAGNRKLNKRKSRGRIDGLIAEIMAIGASLRKKEKPKIISMYDRGLS